MTRFCREADTVQSWLGRLKQRCLVSCKADGRLWVHDVLVMVARDILSTGEEHGTRLWSPELLELLERFAVRGPDKADKFCVRGAPLPLWPVWQALPAFRDMYNLCNTRVAWDWQRLGTTPWRSHLFEMSSAATVSACMQGLFSIGPNGS